MIITTVSTENSALIPIGRQEEKDVREVWFDLSYMIDNFGEGTAELHHQRSKDAAPYPCTVERRGTQLVWRITDVDNAFEGIGKAEIRWYVNGTDDDRAKTAVYKTNTLKSLTGSAEVPDPYESWYDALLTKIGDSQEYAEQAAKSAQDAETAAGTAAQDAVSAVRAEMSGYANSARQSAESAAQSAQALSGMTVTVGATDKGSGIVEISATVNRG